METKHLRKYAPEARRDFIEAVTNKAAVYGLLPDEILPMQEDGDVVIIGDRPFPRSVAKQRKELEERIRKEGFQQFIEAIAYTWFNRFVAVRYMELHGYLDHGYRVLSHPEGKSTPEILENAERIELSGLKRDEVVDLKLDGGKDEQLYQMLLLAQCNALHKAMPFLFESIKDGTELLLPDNLLHTDSLVRTLVSDIPEEQWENVEIIGWLYQFYISEKKDEVIGKVVKSEDIPAATQLFTPNWIVKYLVQNSLGRQWVATYTDSPLKQQMEFYIEPAEQTPEVQQQLDEITPDNLDPEELTLLDPACGSGHILVEAYDLFKAIYLERGYRPRDIPKLVLMKNLYGLEIDERAAQLAAFALMMKARKDDRRIFESEVRPNVVVLRHSQGLDGDAIHHALTTPMTKESEPAPPAGHLFEPDDNLFTRAEKQLATSHSAAESFTVAVSEVDSLLALFADADTFGSLIEIPPELSSRLGDIENHLLELSRRGDLTHITAQSLAPFVRQATVLAAQYNVVVTNPPYMGGGNFNGTLKSFVKQRLPMGLANLYACFIARNLQFAQANGSVAMVNLSTWMFLEDYKELREEVLDKATVASLIHNGRGVWGSDFDSCAFILSKHSKNANGVFRRLYEREFDIQSNTQLQCNFFNTHEYPIYTASKVDFGAIPGAPLVFWLSRTSYQIFQEMQCLSDFADLKVGLQTGQNERFLRFWYEVNHDNISFHGPCDSRWYPYSKGGEFRKWYGNALHVVNWENDGHEIRNFRNDKGKLKSRPQNIKYYFREAIEWSDVGQSIIGARQRPKDYHFDVVAMSAFKKIDSPANLVQVQCFLNSIVAGRYMNVIAPGMHYNTGYVGKLPFSRGVIEAIDVSIGDEATKIARADWDNVEVSWDFETHPMVTVDSRRVMLEHAWGEWSNRASSDRKRMLELETRNNELVLSAYGLSEEMSADVHNDYITLYQPNAEEDTRRFVSYFMGCMMGRYSLDEAGLIYAHGGNAGFDASKYSTFPADEDGIVPITEIAWFPDDAVNRFEQFVKEAWPEEHLEENLTFVAENLGMKKGETSRDCIRRYLATGFYKHHLSLYKKRPIYWLFSSGKQRAFQCLVYLHRYNAGTLSRMRTEYVVKLQGKINSRIDQLEDDIPAANSTSHRKKLEKERDTLIKQREELQEFDEKLRHYADQRIELDLDDGVKVNYGKFGDLLAEVKSITGSKPEN